MAQIELNAEQIKKALECCHSHSHKNCPECPYDKDTEKACFMLLMEHSLALINSQEQRIAELEIELKAMRGSANAYKMHIVELTEENKKLTDDNKWCSKRILEADRIIIEVRKNADELSKTIPMMIKEIQANTVREMQERLKEAFEHRGLVGVDCIERKIDQIAKEMLEEEK